ncbi:MAG: hypothetical protein AABX04_07490 [Nanoarchaeota archaeon]
MEKYFWWAYKKEDAEFVRGYLTAAMDLKMILGYDKPPIHELEWQENGLCSKEELQEALKVNHIVRALNPEYFVFLEQVHQEFYGRRGLEDKVGIGQGINTEKVLSYLDSTLRHRGSLFIRSK